MKWKKLALIGCLLVVMALLLSACQNRSGPGDVDSGSDTTETVDPYDDGLHDLDFQDAEIRIACRGTGLWQSELSADPEGGRIDEAVYERNAAVEDRLNVVLTILPGDSDPTVYMRTLYNTIFMAQDNYCEIIAGVQYEAAVYLNKGLFQNIGNARYLDFSQPWWNGEYMNEIGIGSDYIYLAAGDISLTMTAWSSCVFVNTELYTNLYPDKGTLGIYQMVEDNQWTYETLMQMCKEVYVDRDNVEGVSYGDILGFSVNKGTPMDHFSLTANLNFSDRDEDGYPIICINNEQTLNFESALKTLLKETDGVLLYDYHNTAEYTASKSFFDGESLFAVDMLGSAISTFLEMEDDYAIIPMPKLNEDQDKYYSSTHDNISLYGVPVMVEEERLDMVSAVMEAMCAETFRSVSPEYYEIALKTRYIRDGENAELACKMIDLIHNNVRTDFVYINNYSLSRLGTIFRTVMENNSSFTTEYAEIEESVGVKLEDIISKYKKLVDIEFN